MRGTLHCAHTHNSFEYFHDNRYYTKRCILFLNNFRICFCVCFRCCTSYLLLLISGCIWIYHYYDKHQLFNILEATEKKTKLYTNRSLDFRLKLNKICVFPITATCWTNIQTIKHYEYCCLALTSHSHCWAENIQMNAAKTIEWCIDRCSR